MACKRVASAHVPDSPLSAPKINRNKGVSGVNKRRPWRVIFCRLLKVGRMGATFASLGAAAAPLDQVPLDQVTFDRPSREQDTISHRPEACGQFQ